MLRIASFLIAGTLLAASLPAFAQSQFDKPAMRTRPALPPAVATAPGGTPSPSQQLQIQNYRNQLELSQQPSAAVTPQGFRNQLEAGEQLNQLNQQSR
jgi:hypothetical protein